MNTPKTGRVVFQNGATILFMGKKNNFIIRNIDLFGPRHNPQMQSMLACHLNLPSSS